MFLSSSIIVTIFTGVRPYATEVDEEIFVPALVVCLQEAFEVGVLSDDAQDLGVVDYLIIAIIPSP
jgi:hypothetical protein